LDEYFSKLESSVHTFSIGSNLKKSSGFISDSLRIYSASVLASALKY